ncbi:MAG: transposase, partial [Promethearchaeota archaeon]
TKKTFLRFLKRLRRHYAHLHPNIPICLVIDGHPSHRAQNVVQWVEDQLRFFIYRLPKNSPEINPIEYF